MNLFYDFWDLRWVYCFRGINVEIEVRGGSDFDIFRIRIVRCWVDVVEGIGVGVNVVVFVVFFCLVFEYESFGVIWKMKVLFS